MGSDAPEPASRGDDPNARGGTDRVFIRTGRAPLVGRAGVLATLQMELEAALEGESRGVVLAGEAGIGKSRLLDEACALMVAAGGEVLFGHCVDERGMPPYYPWIDALSSLGTSLAPPKAARVVPQERTPEIERQSILSYLTASHVALDAVTERLSSEQAKLRLFASVVRHLAHRARARPVLLAFDDLQWSDAASNELLRYAMIHAEPVPLLVIGAYRIEEAAANSELTRTLDELHRRRLVMTIPIKPLVREETERLVTSLLDREHPSLGAAIHAHCEGNPFFVEEVVRALAEEGRLDSRRDGSLAVADSLPLPRGVVAVIEYRLNRVSGPCRSLLELAALAGRQISIELLAMACKLKPDAIAMHLIEASRAALIRASGPTERADFMFLHDRVRETVEAGINPVHRRKLHERLAAALEALGDPGNNPDRLSTLTHHLRLAHQPERARPYAERLGDASVRTHAYPEAVRAYRLAIDLTAGVPGGALWLKLGDAALAAGEGDAISAYEAAKAAFDAVGDQRGVATALRRLGTAHARREEFDLAVDCLEAAIAVLVGQDWLGAVENAEAVGPDLAETLIELSTVQGTSLALYDEAITAGKRALALSVRGQDRTPTLEARARLALAKTLMRFGNLKESHDILEPARALAVRGGDLDLAAEVMGALANYAYWVGDLESSATAARRRRELALQAGDPYALRHTTPWLANLALAQGTWDEAERLLAEAEPDVERIDSPEPRAFLRQLAGLLRFQQGRYPEAVALLEEAVAGFRGSGPATLVWYLGCLARAYQAVRESDAMERTVAETVELLQVLPPATLPRCPAIAQLGMIAVRTGDVDTAKRWYEALRPYAGQHHWVLVDRVRGMLAATLGDLATAERHFAEAMSVAIRGGIRPEEMLIHAERAIALQRAPSAGTHENARLLLAEARDRLIGLGMTGEASRVAAVVTQSEITRAYPRGLTEREVEVLVLVAKGCTNREIGDRLSISEKTVTNHLTHIFRKADLDNRAAAVAFAFHHGLI